MRRQPPDRRHDCPCAAPANRGAPLGPLGEFDLFTNHGDFAQSRLPSSRLRFVASAVVLLGMARLAGAQPAQVTREFQAGVDAFRLGKLDLARIHLEKARMLDPMLAGPNRFLAAVAQGQGRWQDCIDLARRAIVLNPKSAELADTRKIHDQCRSSAGRAPYRDELGDSAAIGVVSNVPGATVKIGGLTYGGTPLAPRPITPGSLDVEVTKPGFKTVHVKVNALGGIVTDVAIALEPDPGAQPSDDLEVKKPDPKPNGWLVVNKRDQLEVAIDGAITRAPADARIELVPGTHVIEVRQAHKDPWRRRVRITAGQQTTITPELIQTAARERKERVGIGLVGSGGAIAAFGFASTLFASRASDEAREIARVESARSPGAIDTSLEPLRTRADFEDARSRANKWRLISSVAYGAAAVTVGIGAVYLFLGGRESEDVLPPFAVTPVTGGAVVSRELSW